jgi:general stress protein YciG
MSWCRGHVAVQPEQSATTSEERDGMIMTAERKERRGFASMSPEKQREIASKGGRAAHQKGTAHEWTSEEARSAGRKGGQISRGGRGRLVEGESDGVVSVESSAGEPAEGAGVINE